MKRKTNTAPICVRIPKEHFDALKRIARQRAASEDKDISMPDLVRDAINQMYGNIEERCDENS